MKDFKKYLREEEATKETYPFLIKVAQDMILASAQIHINHFRITSGFKHEALGELYENLQDWADKLIEALMGFTETGNIEFQVMDFKLNVEDPVENSIEILEQIATGLTDVNHDLNEGLESIITDIIGDIGGYLYKLKHFD